MYIGQTINPIERRFNRHMNDAENNHLDTHFARAIRKHGEDSFRIECIDTANTQDELTRKEYYWIRFYDSTNPNNGYNETDSELKCGGDTYARKTDEELAVIKSKISESRIGANNPNAKSVKCKNVVSGEELHFQTVRECQEYFQERTHRFITTRVNEKTRSLYKGEWAIAYEDKEYKYEAVVNKRGRKVDVKDLTTGVRRVFESLRLCERETGISRSLLRKLNDKIYINQFEITILD